MSVHLLLLLLHMHTAAYPEKVYLVSGFGFPFPNCLFFVFLAQEILQCIRLSDTLPCCLLPTSTYYSLMSCCFSALSYYPGMCPRSLL
jgi:hypothetical protein